MKMHLVQINECYRCFELSKKYMEYSQMSRCSVGGPPDCGKMQQMIAMFVLCYILILFCKLILVPSSLQ